MHTSASFDGVDSSALQRGAACKKININVNASDNAATVDTGDEYQLITNTTAEGDDESLSPLAAGIEDPGVFWTVFPGWAVLTKSMMGAAYLVRVD